MVTVRLPDGKERSLPDGATALDLAKAISEGLARDVVAAKVDGEVTDLRIPLKDGVKVELLKADSEAGQDTLNHAAEHLMAAAVVRLYPGAQVTMGPRHHATEFYYDFDIGRPFTPEDLEKIEAEMKKLIADKVPFTRKEMSKAEAQQLFESLGQRYKPEILAWIPDDTVSIYQCGDFVDLCRGPHVQHAGAVKSLKLLSNSGSYWRGDSSKEMLQRITGVAFGKKEDLEKYLYRIEEAKKRDHRKLGRELELFLVSEKGDAHDYSEENQTEIHAIVVADDGKDEALAAEALKVVTTALGASNVRKSVDFQRRGADEGTHVSVRVSGVVTPEARGRLQAAKLADGDVPLKVNVEPHFVEEVGPGLVLWLPKGGRLRSIVEDQWRKMHFAGGYDLVFSPHIAKTDLWKVSGHWNFYRESMFSPMSVDGHDYVCKPMNCPFHIMMVKSKSRSYREFPMRIAELGTVYRYELAGVLHGLMRVRGFTQDDAHIFCRWDQVEAEIDRVMGFILDVLRTFGFTLFEVNLSTRPEKSVGEAAAWERAEKALEAAIKRHDLPYQVDVGGGAFYGPKIDVKLVDALDRRWQCSTLQLDFNNPERFAMEFVNSKGEKEQPVMLHRALLGSLERFVGILVEQYAGAFPMWLAPEQVRVCTVSDKHLDHGHALAAKLAAAGFRVDVDESSDKLGAKIRQAQLQKIPAMLVVGDKEVEAGGATVRLRDGTDKGLFALDALVEFLRQQAEVPSGRPHAAAAE
jgi:threonyl-tRNA synthetase